MTRAWPSRWRPALRSRSASCSAAASPPSCRSGSSRPTACAPAEAPTESAALGLHRVTGVLPGAPAADQDADPGAPVVERPHGDLEAGRLAGTVAVEDQLLLPW